MSASFKPTFDSSTLYFANQSLEWLVNPPKNIDFENIFSKIRDKNIWGKSDETDSLYNKLNQIFFLENGVKITSDGKINFDGFDGGRGSNGNILIQMIFGLMCLSKVIESIVLGEEINYLPHPGAECLKPLDEIANNFIFRGQDILWKTVELTDEEKIQYIDWTKRISENEILNSRIEEINIKLFSQPYMSFGAVLFDISNGISHLLTSESNPAIKKITYAISPDKLKELPMSAFICSESDLVLVGRTNGYITNGLFYQYIANLKKIDYIANEYRSPLLDILDYTKDLDDKSRIFEIIRYIGDEIGEEKKNWVFEESIDITNLIFASVISNSENASKIIHEAYKMREELSSLRDYIAIHGVDEKIKRDIKDLLSYKINQNKVIELKTKYINIPLQGSISEFLLKPRYFKSKQHLSSISMLVDKYKSMIALTEILSKFYSPKSSKRKREKGDRLLFSSKIDNYSKNF